MSALHREWRESRLQGMTTTLRKIRAAGPCGMRLEDGQRVGYLKLRHHLGKGHGDDTPIDITTILDSNGLDDALWCLRAVDGHAREIRLYAVWCAPSDYEPAAAWDAAWNAACQAAAWAARDASAATEVSAWNAAWDAARATQAAELKRICAEIAAGRDPYPAAGVIA